MENIPIDIELKDIQGQVANLSDLLDSVILNRNKRKAKQVVKTGIEFLFAVGSLIFAVKTDEGDGASGPALAFAGVIMVFVTFHAYQLPPNVQTSSKIEEAYKETNSKPFLDGILEIPLAHRFGGAVMAYTLWTVFLLVFVSIIVILIETESGAYIVSAILAALTLYDLTSDMCEYWVYTRAENFEEEKAVEEQK